MCVISAPRERLPDEITPMSVEHSHTSRENEKLYAVAHAIDLDLGTISLSSAGSDGKSWLKVNLAELNCIHQVIRFNIDGIPFPTWTCSSTDCSACEGNSKSCSGFLVTTSSERTSSDDLPLIPDCKYGDTVKLEEVRGHKFTVREIAITGKQGEIRHL